MNNLENFSFAKRRALYQLIDLVQECARDFGDYDALEQLTLDQLREFGNWENNYNVPECWEGATKNECIEYWRDDMGEDMGQDFTDDYRLIDHIVRFIKTGNCPIEI